MSFVIENFFKRQLNRIYYSAFRVSLWSLHLFVRTLIFFSFFINKKKKDFDIALYPYAQEGSDGYTRRFGEYIPFLENDNIAFKIFHVCKEQDYILISHSAYIKRLYFYLRIFFKRIFQVIKVRNYKTAFIHRNLFPYYFDQKIPILEKLAYKLCNHVVIDYWDSVWINKPVLCRRTAEYCHTISVVNDFVRDYFQVLNKQTELFPIGVNLDNYLLKEQYELIEKNCLTIFYTGSPINVETMLNELERVFQEIVSKIKIRMLLVSREKVDNHSIQIEHHLFSEETFFQLLTKADIGIYAVDESDISKGKMAMKVLDYASAALPCVASPYGLTPFAMHQENILIAKSHQDWINYLLLMYENKDIRMRLGKKSRKMMELNHNMHESYKHFKKIMKL